MRRPGRGWLVVSVAFGCTALAVGSSSYAFGLFVGPLEDQFGWARTHISASLSFMALGSLAGPLLGRAMDRMGARPVMAASVAAMGLSFALRPLMTELWHWYALSALQFAAFTGVAVLPAGRLVGLWFPRARGRVMGMVMMGNNFGGLLVPALVGVAIAAGTWKAAYLGLGAAALVLAAAAALVVSEPAADRGDGPVRDGADEGWSAGRAVRSRAFFAVAGAIMLGNFTYTIVLPHVFVHLEATGVGAAAATVAVSVMAACGMGGKVALGYMTERVPARFVMMTALGGQIAGIALMLLTAPGAGIWPAVGVFGFFMGSFGALMPLLVQDTFGMRSFGTIMGLVSATTVVSFGLGPLFAGLSYDLWGGYGPAFAAAAAMFGVAAALLAWAGEPGAGGVRAEERRG